MGADRHRTSTPGARRAGAAGWLVAALLLSACTSYPDRLVMPADPLTDPFTAGPGALSEPLHELAIGDAISVAFPYKPEFSQDVVVQTDGTISLPFIGVVRAAGRSPRQIENEIGARYAALEYDPSNVPAGKRYVLGVEDVLEIKFDVTSALDDTVTVRPDGRISLALVKTVLAEGRTPEELERELVAAYAAFLKHPELVVIVRQTASDRAWVDGKAQRPGVRDLDSPSVMVRGFVPRQVYVAGEVKTPGFVGYHPPLTALQAIVAAGGDMVSGEMRSVMILRKVGTDKPTAILLNLASDVEGESSNDVLLRPYDVVLVPQTSIAAFHEAMDQYFYQLIPAMRNLNFSFLYELNDEGPNS